MPRGPQRAPPYRDPPKIKIRLNPRGEPPIAAADIEHAALKVRCGRGDSGTL
jgi:hypothetical protein